MVGRMGSAMGMGAGQVLILQQAFANAGLGGDQFAGAIARMQKALGGVDEEGKSTEAALARLGIAAGELGGLGADAQLARLSSGFSGIADPSTRARTAMELFGRSGAKMLAILGDPAAMQVARQQVGSLAPLMDRSAASFDAVSDAMGAMQLKNQQLWAGFAEQLAPALGETTSKMAAMDFTGVGAGIARAAQNAAAFARALGDVSSKLPGVQLATTTPDLWRPQTALAYGFLGWAHRRPATTLILTERDRAQPGDIVTFDFSHVGIVEADNGASLTTIEGNTNGRGDRDSTTGDGVFRKVRAKHLARNFIRIRSRIQG